MAVDFRSKGRGSIQGREMVLAGTGRGRGGAPFAGGEELAGVGLPSATGLGFQFRLHRAKEEAKASPTKALARPEHAASTDERFVSRGN